MLLPRPVQKFFAASQPTVARVRCGAAVAVACALSAGALHAQESSTDGPGRSPFLPQGWEQRGQGAAKPQQPGAEQPAGQYVFNGVITIGSRTLYSISNTQTQQAVLVEIGDRSQEIQVNAYDPERNVLTMSSGGRTEDLSLRKSDGEPIVAAQQGRGNFPQGRGPNAVGGNNAGAMRPMPGRPSVEQMEARYQRMGQIIAQRRAAEAAAGSSVVVGAEQRQGGGSAQSASGRQQGSGSNRQMQGGTGTGAQGESSGPRRRTLRMEMNQ